MLITELIGIQQLYRCILGAVRYECWFMSNDTNEVVFFFFCLFLCYVPWDQGAGLEYQIIEQGPTTMLFIPIQGSSRSPFHFLSDLTGRHI